MRSHFSILLTLLLLWHVGACPCGCLEHNAWVELFVELDGEGEGAGDANVLGRSLPFSTFALSSPHCEGTGRPVYTLSGSDRNPRLRDGAKGNWSPPCSTPPSDLGHRACKASALHMGGVIPVHLDISPQLADLQVWRI